MMLLLLLLQIGAGSQLIQRLRFLDIFSSDFFCSSRIQVYCPNPETQQIVRERL
jgi:hypothetical protein